MTQLTYTVIRQIAGADKHKISRNLRDLAARNLADRQARTRRVGMARVAAAGRRIEPGAVVPPAQRADVPLTFKAPAPERRRVTRPATVAPPVAAEPTYAPILAKDVPAEIKAVAKIHKNAGELSADWFMVGFTGPDGSTVDYYARLHGASVRYAVAA